MKQISQWEPTN